MKKSNQLERDSDGLILMSLRSLKICLQKEELFTTPQLNEKLLLHFKGFHRIQNLEKFINIKALWLNNNAISKIQNLQNNKQLISVYLNNNLIKKIQNLHFLTNISILNLSFNKIQIIENLSQLTKLNNLNLSNNLLSNNSSIQKIVESKSLVSLDLSNNQLDGAQTTLQFFKQLPYLTCLYLKNTPIVRTVKFYRKTFISSLQTLKFLDDRPVNDQQRRLVQAWSKGGIEAQNIEKIKLMQQKQQKNKRNYEDFEKLAGPPRLKREKIYEQLSKEKRQQRQRLMKKREQLRDEKDMNYNYLVDVSKEIEQIDIYLKNLEEECRYIGVRQNSSSRDYYVQWRNNKIRIINKREVLSLEEDVINKVFKSLEQVQGLKEQEEKQEGKQQIEIFLPILELLLEKYKFQFDQATEELNLLIQKFNQKLNKKYHHFNTQHIRQIWTQKQIHHQKQNQYLHQLD